MNEITINDIRKTNKLQEKLFNKVFPKPRKNGKFMKAILSMIKEEKWKDIQLITQIQIKQDSKEQQ